MHPFCCNVESSSPLPVTLPLCFLITGLPFSKGSGLMSLSFFTFLWKTKANTFHPSISPLCDRITVTTILCLSSGSQESITWKWRTLSSKGNTFNSHSLFKIWVTVNSLFSGSFIFILHRHPLLNFESLSSLHSLFSSFSFLAHFNYSHISLLWWKLFAILVSSPLDTSSTLLSSWEQLMLNHKCIIIH